MDNDLTGIDFFRDERLVDDPYPIYEALRSKCPVEREDHYGVDDGHGLAGSRRRLQRRRDVLVVHLGHRPVSRIPGSAGGLTTSPN